MLFVFSLTDFNILSLFSVLAVLMIICHGEVLFWSSLFDILETSYTWKGKSFSRFGKFSVILLLNKLCIPLVILLLLLQCPWFSGLVLWWSHWVFAYSFHSSWVVWLRVFLFYSLISTLSSSSEILSSTCSSLLEWPSIVFFVWL
jgi:hypothetical protein